MNVWRQGIKSVLTSVLPCDCILDRGPRPAKGIAVTFDDGPHPEYTPRILDELQRLQIRATFFIVGEAAARQPALVRRIAAEGHGLAGHSYTHSEPAATSAAVLLDEVQRTRALLEDLTGEPIRLFRPPKGKLTLTKLLGLWQARQTIVLWNQDPRDYRATGPEGILPWVAAYRPAAGDIVLLHDTHPHCIVALESLVQQVARQQETWNAADRFATVAEWLPGPPRKHLMSCHDGAVSLEKLSQLATAREDITT